MPHVADSRNKWNSIDQSAPRVFCRVAPYMPHPQLCHLVLRCLFSYTSSSSAARRCHDTSLVSHVLMKVISIAKHSDSHQAALYAHGLVELVLQRFQQVLQQQDVSASSAQYPVELTLLLDLFLVLSKHRFSSRDLRLCLRLFQNDDKTPVDLLLKTYTVLAENLTTQPTHILCFPVILFVDPRDLELTSRSLSEDTLTISLQAHDGTKSREATLG